MMLNAFYISLPLWIHYVIPNLSMILSHISCGWEWKTKLFIWLYKYHQISTKMFPPGIYLATKWRKSIQRLAIKYYTQTRGAALMLPIVLRPGGSQHHIWPQFVPCVCRKISWRSDWQYDSSTMYFVIPQGSPAIWLLVATVAFFDQKVSIS